MKWFGRVLGYGFLVWLFPFVVSFFVFPFHESWRSLFESVMAVAVVVATVACGLAYFRKAPPAGLRDGLLVGGLWWLISVGIDLPLFSAGPMKTTLTEYFADIGLTYVAIPVITLGLAASYARTRVEGTS
jgi:hypothetical protein